MIHLVIYFAVGTLVAIFNDQKVIRDLDSDGYYLRTRERVLMALRATLAWPTYLAEDFFFWADGANED
jgi:hypothetical protein